MDQRGDAARLARELRIWRASACCLAVLAMPAGVRLAQNGAPVQAAGARPIATLELPAGLKAEVMGDRFTQDTVAKKTTVSGTTTVTWSNGVRLTVPTAKVSLETGAAKPGLQRITLEP